MKKVSLVTIFDTINFGTYLQALATAIKIQELGADVEVLRYERKHNWYRVPFENTFHFLKFLSFLYALFTKNKSYFQKKACRKFVSSHVKVSRLYYTYGELCSHRPKADVFVTGSDQVWNTIHNSGIERVYYLEFVPDDVRKVAFSSSIGMDYWDSRYLEESKQLLTRYYALSVRESQAVDLLSMIGLHSVKVVDPTFLLSRIEWSKYANIYEHQRPYVLVYSVEGGECDMVVSKTARQVANHIGGDVIEVNYVGEYKQIPDCDKHFYYATPDIFLSLMLGADFVVASSFHGTAFAVNLNIPFISVAPERFSSRIDSLLMQVGLLSRKIINYDYNRVEDILAEHVDFSYSNTVISEDVHKTIDFINKNIIN